MTNHINFKQLQRYVPVTRPTIWEWVKAGTFPAPIRLNPQAQSSLVVWPEDEVLAWLASRPRGFNAVRPGLDPAQCQAARQATRRATMSRRKERKAAAPGIGHNSRGWVGPTSPSGFVRRAP
jgi:predicted DNA-binding transcriptional regulator AlpA